MHPGPRATGDCVCEAGEAQNAATPVRRRPRLAVLLLDLGLHALGVHAHKLPMPRRKYFLHTRAQLSSSAQHSLSPERERPPRPGDDPHQGKTPRPRHRRARQPPASRWRSHAVRHRTKAVQGLTMSTTKVPYRCPYAREHKAPRTPRGRKSCTAATPLCALTHPNSSGRGQRRGVQPIGTTGDSALGNAGTLNAPFCGKEYRTASPRACIASRNHEGG